MLQPTLQNILANEIVYAKVDGSMIFTCDDAWKEVKVGRIFKASDGIKTNTENGYIKHKQYLSHLGNSQTFTNKMDRLIDNYNIKPQ